MKTALLCFLLVALPAFAQQKAPSSTNNTPIDPNNFQSEFQIVQADQTKGSTLPGTVTAKIEPTSINMNHGAIITIRIVQQSQAGAPPKITVPTPKVDGLIFRPNGTNWNNGSTDGVYKTTTQWSFSVRPLAPGDYIIPAFDVAEPNGGKTYHIPALTLTVTP